MVIVSITIKFNTVYSINQYLIIMVNRSGALTGQTPAVDDALKEFFTNLLQTSVNGFKLPLLTCQEEYKLIQSTLIT